MEAERPSPSLPDPDARTFLGVLYFLTGTLFLYSQYVAWTRYQANLIFFADAGIFDSIIASFRHGIFLESPLTWDIEANYFADHFRPILFVVMPFYLIADHALTYLTVQNAALFGAAIPLAFFAKDRLRNGWLALAIAALYLFNHFTLSIRMANHPEAMAFLGLFTAFFAENRNKPVFFSLGLLWALAVKQDFGLYVAAYGLALCFNRERRIWGICTLAGGILWFLMALVIMKFCGQEALHAAGTRPLSRFADLGTTPFEIAFALAANPLLLLERLFRPVLIILFASTCFLALVDWRRVWLVFATASIMLVSRDPVLHGMLYYYSYPAIAFLFLSTVRGIETIMQWATARSHSRAAFFALIPLLGVGVLVQAVLPTRTDGLRMVPAAVTDRQRLASDVIDLIPEDAPVAVQYDLFAKVPNRPVKLPMRFWALSHVDYVLLDTQGRAADLYGEEKAAEREALSERLASPEFTIEFEAEGYVLLRRQQPPPANLPEIISPR